MEIEFDNESDDTGTVVKIKAANQVHVCCVPALDPTTALQFFYFL